MDDLTTIRIELGIQAQKIMSHVQINNETIQDKIQEGIEKGLTELLVDENFVNIISEATKKQVYELIDKYSFGYDLKQAVSKAMQTKVMNKMDEYADKLAERVAEILLPIEK